MKRIQAGFTESGFRFINQISPKLWTFLDNLFVWIHSARLPLKTFYLICAYLLDLHTYISLSVFICTIQVMVQIITLVCSVLHTTRI